MSTPPSHGVAGQVWAVLSIRNILQVNDVAASSSCSLFSTKEEALKFAQMVVTSDRNWIVKVALVPVLLDHRDGIIPNVGPASRGN